MDFIMILGLVAASCTTASFVPQAVKTIKTKDTRNISLYAYIFLTVGGILWLIYGICTHNIPIILTNSFSLILTLIILGLKIWYKQV